jgi:hypothetical protein
MRVSGGGSARPAKGSLPGHGRFADSLRDARHGTPCDEERSVSASAPASAPARPPEPASAPELRAAVRSLPVAIQAARLRSGEPLALSFGRSLDVEIRAGATGIEIALRPDPRLSRAAEAELRALVATLRARGIAVARAEVRARGGAQERPRPR